MGFAVSANACDYAAELNRTAAWLVTQQITSGANLGGIQEAENMSATVETDNTQEAIWVWSRYAELTGDYTTYQTKINNAWTYCNANPAWNEGGTPTNYYSVYNMGWGLMAEMKYRQVYLGKAGYVDHTSYGRTCANTLVNNTPPSTDAQSSEVLGRAVGSLYQYGVFDNNSTYRNRAVVLGGNVKSWLDSSTSNFNSQGWAVSAGVAVWGVVNSYFKDPNHSAEAPAWAETANTYMPASDTGTSDGYQNGHNGWYAWGHYALSEIRGADSFTKYQNLINTLLSQDGDNDGGIPQQGSTGADYAWTTDIMQTASNMGLVGNIYTISGTITSGGSALAGVQMSGLPGAPVTNASGFYTAQVTSGWIGTVTPIKTGYTFIPATRTYTAVTSSQTSQNYTASVPPSGVTIGSWLTGTTHAKEAGANRALIFVAHAKSSSVSNLTAVTYGGRAMTKITDKIIGSGSSRAYVAAFILNDANITAATTTTFTPVWTNAPSSVTYSSVFLQNVNQTALTGAFAGNGLTTGCSLSTTPLATSSGDMVIESAASSVAGTYTVTTGWTKDIDLSVTCYDGMNGHKAATGASETPSVIQSSGNHSLIGYVVKVAPPSVYILTVNTAGSGSLTRNPDQASYTSGTVVTLTANPLAGWLFSGWSGDANGTSNPATITMNSNKSATATFGIQTFNVTGTAGANGSITPTIAVVNYNGSQLFTATANTGYVVDKWTVDGSPVQTGGTTCTLSNITATHTVAVSFKILTCTVTASAGANGSINPTGAMTKDYGSSQLFTATANTGYTVDKWQVDGADVQTGGTTYTLSNITATHTVAVSFKILTCTVTASAGANGSINPTGAMTKDYGSSQLFTATANTGYTVDKWTIDGADVQTGGTTCTLSNITSTHTVNVSFKIMTCTVTGTAGANGSITPISAVVNYNGSQLFTATVNTGYMVDKWQVDGADVQTGGTTYTLSNITATHTVAVSFKILTYAITASSGANGSISPSGTFNKDYGLSQLFTATPTTGYAVDKWTVDGNDAQTGGNTYTLSTITAAHTVGVSFKITTYTVTAFADTNGSISPSGTFSKDYGSSQLLTATPTTGYVVDKWTVDGNDVRTGGNTYTLSAITAVHTVGVSFKIITFTLGYTAGANGTLTGNASQVVDYGASGTAVTAVPNTGYHFVKWSDDSTVNPRTDLNVTANIAVTAGFAIDQYTVTGTAGANGSIDPTGDITKDYGSSQLFTATPTTGYAVDKWQVDGADVQTGGTTYTLSNITATHTVSVSFKIMTYVVTSTAGANGTIDPNGDIAKDYDSTQYFTAMPDIGYELDTWYLDGNSVQTGGRYCLNNITANHAVNVTFKIQTFVVTASTDANGSITPTSAVVNYNGSRLFTATPDTGYVVDKWQIDGNDAQASGTIYTLNDITTTHTVAVTFNRIVFSISGYVVEIDGNTPVKDVLLSAGDTNTLTDANGYYELSVGYGWSGVIAPEKEGYVFEPNSDTYDNVTQDYNDVNYNATLMTFKIAGYVLDSGSSSPISNTSVSAENGGGPWTSKYGGGSSLTDANGYYEVLVDYNWSGKVTPAKYAYTFEPNSRSYEDVNADYTVGQDYAGTLLTYKITGYIMNKCGVPVRDVLVSAGNGGGQAMTDANGFYEVWVDYTWTGTLTPTKKHYTFELSSGSGHRATMLVAVAGPGKNYTADNIYDLDCDGYIDLGDVKVMCDNWLMTGSQTPIPGDFDADGTVDFTDFAIFANVWGD